MLVCPTKEEIRALAAGYRRARRSIALVPTMGYLHDGHLALVEEAKRRAEKVIVSIFVNPTQFGPNEDFSTYPRDTDRDLALLRELDVDGVFLPDAQEMYGENGGTYVDVPELSGILQGALRPGHFRGVATVVTKLFNVVQPDVAVFGEKDYQQLTLIRQMVRDLDMPVEIVAHRTVREPDGLAMSSRNVRLTTGERSGAPVLSRSLDAARQAAADGKTVSQIKAVIESVLRTASLGKVETIDIRDAETLGEADELLERPAVILLAVRFGTVLLIDQAVIQAAG
ncbi:pantothenate synthetase [Roseibium aquae]|uniref:Pantothenate synthetase n=1 Tax=Roseibium aquae TaxID=1323746 RepID=A0A916TJ17_9HYPH|nr:pantoate--beta-alanine ligase [Roseibium aquae]GGB46919.1 pantothenate synthetase [Roseibium aquae]